MQPFSRFIRRFGDFLPLALLFSVVSPLPAFRLAVSHFTVTGHDSPDAVETVVIGSFVSTLSTVPGMELLDRTKLDEVLEEQNLALSGLVDSNTVVGIGDLAGAEAVLTGDLVMFGDEGFLSAMIIDCETGVVLYSRSGAISGSLTSAVSRESVAMAAELRVDGEGRLAGNPAALWATRSAGSTGTARMREAAARLDGGSGGASSGLRRILIYAMSDVSDSVDAYGQWYLGPKQLLPVTGLLRDAGFDVRVHDRRTLPRLAGADLSDFGQVWIMEGDADDEVDPDIDDVTALLEFHAAGGGVWLSGENVMIPGKSCWIEDINEFAEPLGFAISDGVAADSIVLPVPPSVHPLLRGIENLVFDCDVGLIDAFDPDLTVLVPLGEESRIIDPSMAFEELFAWADPDRYLEAFASGNAYYWGWLLGDDFERVGPKVPPGSPGIVCREGREGQLGRLIGDSGWLMGWAFTDTGYDEYLAADNLRFVSNAASWLEGGD